MFTKQELLHNISTAMTMRRFFGVLLLALCSAYSVSAADDKKPEEKKAPDLKFRVQLIWGTNDEKAPEPALKEVGPRMNERLTKVFKWKHYYEVFRDDDVEVPVGKITKVKCSEKCVIALKDLGKPMLEVTLFGEGREVKKVTQKAITPNDCLVLGGDGTNDSAWFVVISSK